MFNLQKVSYRMSLLAILTGITMFIPWFSVNVVFSHIGISPTSMSWMWLLILFLAVIGLVSSTINYQRFRALVEIIIGGLLLLLVIISSIVIHQSANNLIQNFMSGSNLGGMVSEFAGSGGNRFTQQISGLLIEQSFGFYMAIIVGLLMVGFGVRYVVTTKTERLFPEHWNVEFKIKNASEAILKGSKKTAATLADTGRKVSGEMQAEYQKRTPEQRKKLFMYIGGGVAGIVLLLIVLLSTLSIYNQSHSESAVAEAIINDINAHQTSGLSSMVSFPHSLYPQAWALYEENNTGAEIQNLINQASGTQPMSVTSALATVQEDQSAQWAVTNNFGFTSYHLLLPDMAVQFQSTTSNGTVNATYSLNGKTINNGMYLIPGNYSFVASVNSPFGSVKQMQTINISTEPISFDFSQDTLTLYANDFSGGAKIFYNSKSKTVNFVNSDSLFSSGESYTFPIAPINNGGVVTVKLGFPFGTYYESGKIESGQLGNNGASVNFAADPTKNNTMWKQIGKTINQFNELWTKSVIRGKFNNSIFNYLMPGSPSYQQFQNDSQSPMTPGSQIYVSAYLDPASGVIYKTTDGAIGVKVNDTEIYQGSHGETYEWTYGMEYDRQNHKWRIENMWQNNEEITANTPNAIKL